LKLKQDVDSEDGKSGGLPMFSNLKEMKAKPKTDSTKPMLPALTIKACQIKPTQVIVRLDNGTVWMWEPDAGKT
jgi:hypothetical protein